MDNKKIYMNNFLTSFRGKTVFVAVVVVVGTSSTTSTRSWQI